MFARKLWILFPPSDIANLYVTRIPYEESSIFSQVNFQCIDLNKFPLLKQTKPRIIELKAGEVLFVPRHWWHYVENVVSKTSGEAEEVSISVNTWLTANEQENSLSECLVQFLASSLFDTYGHVSWLNLNADLFKAQEAKDILISLLVRLGKEPYQQQQQQSNNNNDKQHVENKTNNCNNNNKKARTHIRHYLEEGCLEDILRIKKVTEIYKRKKEEQKQEEEEIIIKDVVNCILDPEVIDLIKCKLKLKFIKNLS